MGERMPVTLPQYERKSRISSLLFGSNPAKTVFNIEITPQMRLNVLKDDSSAPIYNHNWQAWDDIKTSRIDKNAWNSWPDIDPNEVGDSMSRLQMIEPVVDISQDTQKGESIVIPVSPEPQVMAEQVLIPMPPPTKEIPPLPERRKKSFFSLRRQRS